MKLKSYLAEKQINASAFAASIGVSPSTITRILNGERTPGLALVMLIKERTAGEVAPEDFLEAAERVA